MKKATGFLKRGLRIDEKERTGERWRRRHEREKVKKNVSVEEDIFVYGEMQKWAKCTQRTL